VLAVQLLIPEAMHRTLRFLARISRRGPSISERRRLTSGNYISIIALLAAGSLLGCATPPPIPAHEEQVRFRNGDVTLAGTLYLPAGSGRHPAVLLYHGSGEMSRFDFWGHWFSSMGFACLTYDKRGVGESTGDFTKVSFLDLVNDGLAGIELLKSRRDIDPKRIGVWGISQGGWLGPLAASKSKDVAFVIAVSGPGVSPGDQMIFYYASEFRRNGMPEREIAEASDLRNKVWHYLSTGDGYAEANAALTRAQTQPWFPALKEQSDGLFKKSPVSSILEDPKLRNRLWFKVEMNYDPTVALRGLTVPSLFLFGEDDQLVPVPKSVDVIRRTLTESGRSDFTIKTFPKADHGIRVDGDFAPGYLETMRTWLKSR
jgi:pimeloyl-ACP methyl ester carboxylesterase